MSFVRPPILILLTAAVSACAVGPEYERPSFGSAAEFSDIVHVDSSVVADHARANDAWWTSFGDPVLTELVDQAVARSPDVRAATARIDEARALRQLALAGMRPSLDASVAASRSRQSEVANLPPAAPTLFSLFESGLAAAWEPDLFGRLQRTVEASTASLEASVEDRRSVLLVTLSELALNYADLRSAQRQRTVAVENTSIARKTLELTALLRGKELASELDLVRARADVTESEAAQAEFSAAEHGAAARIAVLLGEEPRRVISRLTESPEHELRAPRVPVGLASELLERRPDVRAAERRLAAASAEIGIETAGRFPQFNLTGTVGSGAVDMADLFSSPSEAWSIAGALSWPLFDGGRRRAAVDAASARFNARLAEYESSVLLALSDAEAAFASYIYAAKERQLLENARADRLRALELSRLRFEADLDDLFPVLDAQRQLLSLDSQAALAERAELIAAVNVYRALGGGWESTEERLLTAETP